MTRICTKERGVKTSWRPRSRSCSGIVGSGAARTGRMESSHRAVVRITESPNPRALIRYPTLAAGPRTWRTGGLRRRLRKLRLTWDSGVETTRLSSCSTPRPGSWSPPSQPSCLDGGPQPPALLHLRGHTQQPKIIFCVRPAPRLHLQEPPELLFHAPRQRTTRRWGRRWRIQPPRARACAESVAAQQQTAVRPGGVNLVAARSSRSRISRCHPSHQVGQLHQMEPVDDAQHLTAVGIDDG